MKEYKKGEAVFVIEDEYHREDAVLYYRGVVIEDSEGAVCICVSSPRIGGGWKVFEREQVFVSERSARAAGKRLLRAHIRARKAEFAKFKANRAASTRALEECEAERFLKLKKLLE